jgi:hypothetical protein
MNGQPDRHDGMIATDPGMPHRFHDEWNYIYLSRASIMERYIINGSPWPMMATSPKHEC